MSELNFQADPKLAPSPQDLAQTQNKTVPAWLMQLQIAAHETFTQTGLPNRHDEHWKYLDLNGFKQHSFTLPSTIATTAKENVQPSTTLPGVEAHALVFVNGALQTDLTHFNATTPGIELIDLATLAETSTALQHFNQFKATQPNHSTKKANRKSKASHPFAMLNTAYHEHAYLIRVAAQTKLDKPLHLEYLFDGPKQNTTKTFAFHPRILLLVEEHAELTVFETHGDVTTNTNFPYWNNPLIEVDCATNSRLHWHKLQLNNENAFHIAGTHFQLNTGTTLHYHYAALGGILNRDDIQVHLLGEHAEANFNGLLLTTAQQQTDLHFQANHHCPRTRSTTYIKSAAAQTSKAIINGKIFVDPEATQTSAHLTNKNLLLSQQATINTKPELEIYTDDVQCSHGATVGALDETALFFLRSRGLDHQQAKQILIDAFFNDLLAQFANPILREKIRTQLTQHLNALAQTL